MSKKNALRSDIRDNYSRGKAGDYIAESLTPKTELSVVSAYFTINAYSALQSKLDAIKGLRFLFGEPAFIGRINTDRQASKAFRLTEHNLELSDQLSQCKLARDCAKWITNKVEVRSVRRAGFLHGKMYHIKNGEKACALLGSSNFTVPGLGLYATRNNVELNLVVDSDRDREDLLSWFNDWWGDDEQTIDIKKNVLQELERLHSDNAPEFIYYLTLFNIFRKFLDSEQNTAQELTSIALPDTLIWKQLYDFQKDGAKAAINKIQNLNGCILADSVGLGKTFTALAVIKYFELKNERVLVLCPKKLRRNWTIYRNSSKFNPFDEDRFRYDVLSHTDLSRHRGEVDGIDLATLNWGNYDLLVIDESHNFRNNNQAKQTSGEPPRQTRYQKLINDIVKAGIRTKVLLLSATPVNNNLADLRNQISFIAGGDVAYDAVADGLFDATLAIKSVKETARKAQQKFTIWAKQPPEQRSNRTLLKEIGGDFFHLLDGLSIARSRKQIQRYYKKAVHQLGEFPERPSPISLHPQIDRQQEHLSFESLSDKIDRLTLALYNPTGYLRDDLDEKIKYDYQREVLGTFNQQGRERILIGMMKVNFLKRLESSVFSFRETLKRTIEKIDTLEQKFSAFENYQNTNPDMDYETLVPDDLDDPELEDNDFIVGKKQRIHLHHINIPRWREKTQHDREQLQELLEQMQKIDPERDGKLKALEREIDKKLQHPNRNKDGYDNHKLLIFTAFADTAQYLYENLSEHIQRQNRHLALIRGDGGNKTTLGRADYDDILTNFSPISKQRSDQTQLPQDEEIDILIATDCISEGQNLQDCDLLINYDIHWNPVRIIQRFGRIDRIGSRNEKVHLINFWPVQDLDRYLNVRHRIEARMALVDLSATQTDSLLNKELIEQDLLFRNQQIKRLQNEFLDLEDFEDNITLSDFSLDEFRLDLLQFLETRRDELEQAKPGLYAVVPPQSDNPIAQPGVIFCLRNREREESRHSSTKDIEDINPLGQYYLLYVLDDGDVRLTFTQPKQALNLFRDLAAKHDGAFRDLCKLFDQKTEHGANMDHYNHLIKQALRSIKNTFNKRALGKLTEGRDGRLPRIDKVPTDDGADYELVTWLVILEKQKDPQS